jgi:ABC-type dipeptide/oligopeptide/nickel transport system permease subunit
MVSPSAAAAIPAELSVSSPRRGMFRRLLSVPRAAFGLAVLTIVLFCALFARWLIPMDINEMDFSNLLGEPSQAHPLGTDQLGRDVLSRLIVGSQTALSVSVGAVGLGVIFGVPLGLTAVYFGSWVDDVIMRLMDALIVFPALLIAVALAASLGSSLATVILAIGFANVPWIARIVRSQGLSVREQDYVAAAIVGGVGHFRTMFRHILPHTVAPIIVQATLGMGYAVLIEAALGFIGAGVPPPTPTWGNMLQEAFPLLERHPLLSIVPGVAIFFLVLAYNFVGDTLRDLLDPRLKGIIH